MTAGALALCLVVVLAGQGIADSRIAGAGAPSTGAVLGRAGFAYAGGLRTFVAVVLWSRLEPQFHAYYDGGRLEDLLYLVPTLRFITLLDPTLEQAYYILPWILRQNGRRAAALELAREGALENPRSGRLWTAYAQLLFLDGRRREAAQAAGRAIGPQARWYELRDQWIDLGLAGDILKRSGDPAAGRLAEIAAERVKRRMDLLGLDRSEAGLVRSGGATAVPAR